MMDSFDELVRGPENTTTVENIGYVGRHIHTKKAQILREARIQLHQHDKLVRRGVLLHASMETQTDPKKLDRMMEQLLAIRKASRRQIRRINWLLFKARFASNRHG